ncbi:unnamed protein product [Rotaria magnacalcarata]
MISHGKDNFNDIQNCIRNLVDRVQLHTSIKIDFDLQNVKESLEKIFNSLNQCIMNTTTDEGAIHYIRAYLQTTMMIQVDYYMNSVATFRHESLVCIENFEKWLHEFVLNSIRGAMKNEQLDN